METESPDRPLPGLVTVVLEHHLGGVGDKLVLAREEALVDPVPDLSVNKYKVTTTPDSLIEGAFSIGRFLYVVADSYPLQNVYS